MKIYRMSKKFPKLSEPNLLPIPPGTSSARGKGGCQCVRCVQACVGALDRCAPGTPKGTASAFASLALDTTRIGHEYVHACLICSFALVLASVHSSPRTHPSHSPLIFTLTHPLTYPSSSPSLIPSLTPHLHPHSSPHSPLISSLTR